MIYPEIFITGVIPQDRSNKLLLADALCAWACASLVKAPEKFGVVMAEIGERLGVSPLPENLMKLAESKR